MEALAFAALVDIIATIAMHWAELPARVPRHFGVSGAPDRWGGKDGMLVLPLSAIGIYMLTTAASRYQRFINLPMAIDRDRPEVQRLLLSMSIALKLVVLVTFLYIEWTEVEAALGRSSGLGKEFLPIFLFATFFPLGYYLHKLRKYGR